MRNLKSTLAKLAAAVAEEAACNSDFAIRLQVILGDDGGKAANKTSKPKDTRKGGRRTPAVLDPIDIVRSGEGTLRQELNRLEMSQLLDIVAEFGMDPGKLVMKWKDRDRVVERIIDLAVARATKGDAFRAQ